MPRLLRLCHSILLATSTGFSLETVSYVNDAAALPVGARTAGLAGVTLGISGDPSHLALSPAGLADITRPEVVLHHASLYEDLNLAQDEVYVAAPLSFGTLGIGLSRVGADGILRSDRGSSPNFANPATFSATDWIGSVAFAKTWFNHRLRAGAALRVLGRDIDDYIGGGAQLDASAVWLQDGFRAGLRLDRGLGGLAVWKSGRSEYAPPDLILGVGVERRLPYFYGIGALAWETAGLFGEQSASSFSENDARPWIDPWLALRSSKLATEFRFDMGLVLRAGCEIQSLTRMLDFLQGQDQEGQFGESKGSVSVGAGYLWAGKVRVDYALVAHPDLGNSQRISFGIVFGSKPPKPATETESSPSKYLNQEDTTSLDSNPFNDSLTPTDTVPAKPVTSDSTSVKAPLLAPPTQVATPPIPTKAPSLPDSTPGKVPPKPSSPSDEWDAPEQQAP